MNFPGKLNIVADYGDLCGECPIWDPETGVLYWTDCVGQHFYKYDPESGKHQILKQGLEINGYRLKPAGRICHHEQQWNIALGRRRQSHVGGVRSRRR